MLPEAGPGSGKGNALWKSLYACTGDIICWLDADLRNFRAEYVDRLCEPLLADPDIDVREGVLHALVRRRADRRRARHRARRPAAALAAVPEARRHRATARRRVRGAARGARGAAVRRRLGRRARVARRRRRALRARRGRAGRPRRARAPQPSASTSSAAQSLAIIATALRRAGLHAVRRPHARAAARRPRRQRRRRAGRGPRAPADRHDPRYRATRSNRRDCGRTTRVTPVRSEGGAAGFDRGFLDEQRGARSTPRPPARRDR